MDITTLLTKDEFEKGYAERSGVTVEWLHENDLFGIPCDCGEDGCKGWQMAHITTNKDYPCDWAGCVHSVERDNNANA